MPTFDTPTPISLSVELGVGDLRIVAAERTDTIVEIRPSDPAKKSDVTAAEQTRVEFDGGKLSIKGPKGRKVGTLRFGQQTRVEFESTVVIKNGHGHSKRTLRGGDESIDVEVTLPVNSDVRVDAGIVELQCTGRLGDCHLKTGMGEIQIEQAGPLHAEIGVGDIRVEQAGPLRAKTGMGDITVKCAVVHAKLVTGVGNVQLESIDGTAEIKNSQGDTSIGEATGELTVKAGNGEIAVEHAHAGVVAKTAMGDIRLGEVMSGVVEAQTGNGDLEIAVRDGVAAWLDLKTHLGRVDNTLEEADRPQPEEAAVEIHARTSIGDITVGRCTVANKGASR